MDYSFKDCSVEYDGKCLKIGNSSIERAYIFLNGIPVTRHILNKKTGYMWYGAEEKELAVFNLPGFDPGQCDMLITAETADNSGLSEEHLNVTVSFENAGYGVRWTLQIYPILPYISTRIYIKDKNTGKAVNEISEAKHTGSEKAPGLPVPDAIDSINICSRHLKLETISFRDVTDFNDNLVRKYEEQVYANHTVSASGNMFLINSYLDNEGLLIVKDGMTPEVSLNRTQDELLLNVRSFIQITGSGADFSKLPGNEYIPCYGCTVGTGSPDELKRLYKRYYGKVCKGDPGRELFIMSNTWGDRNQGKAVCEAFMLKEIDAAKKLGADIIQIDDGWQKGIFGGAADPADPLLEGFYERDPEFWEVNETKFPNGLKVITDTAKQNGMKIGLWFSPDSKHSFGNWERDAEVLMNFYRKYDICYFKLDSVNIKDKTSEMNLLKLMKKVTLESNNRVSFNLDITAQVRFGYFLEKHFGTLFVENRYTDWGNYYPHKTLKNLWQLSEFIPARKFQFELLNNRRNKDRYMNDPLAPSEYSIDYLFAAVMFSNPLIWMEMSNLDAEDIITLGNVIKAYTNEKGRLFESEIFPVGDVPDGISFAGFQAVTSGTQGYFLFFRELADKAEYTYIVRDLEGKEISTNILYSNADTSGIDISGKVTGDGGLKVKLAAQKSFVFAEYRIK